MFSIATGPRFYAPAMERFVHNHNDMGHNSTNTNRKKHHMEKRNRRKMAIAQQTHTRTKHKKIITTYDELEFAIKQALTKTIGKKVINTSIKKKNSKEVKRAIKHKQYTTKKELYIKTQKTLRTIIEQEEKEKIEKTFKNIINEGDQNPNPSGKQDRES